MPNCDFYGTYEDHLLILNFLFDDNQCEIYESYSEFEKPLKRFFNSSEVLKEFDRSYITGKKYSSVYLQLYVLDSGPKFISGKVKLNSEKCDGFKFRYAAEGYGLVQLYLEVPDDSSLSDSHTNHNTLKRAQKWASTEKDKKEVASLDYSKITKFSSRLNRFIRKISIGKLFSRPVLPSAYELWKKGINFAPYETSQCEIDMK